MQCSSCQASLCSGSGLCFYRKINVVDKIEVHLILKPERAAPESFASLVFSGSQVLCKCGAHLGDTVAHGPKRAAFTAFKSHSVTLFNTQPLNKKVKWPHVYSKEPYSAIGTRCRESFFGDSTVERESRLPVDSRDVDGGSSMNSPYEFITWEGVRDHKGGGGGESMDSYLHLARVVEPWIRNGYDNDSGYLPLRVSDIVKVQYVRPDQGQNRPDQGQNRQDQSQNR